MQDISWNICRSFQYLPESKKLINHFRAPTGFGSSFDRLNAFDVYAELNIEQEDKGIDVDFEIFTMRVKIFTLITVQ